MRLSDATIRSLAPEPKQRIISDDSLAGFGLRISPQGTKAFVLTYGANRERVTIGRYPIISLSEARTEARRILAERTLGKTRPPRTSLEDALATYYQKHVSQLRPGTQREIKRLFGRFFPSRLQLEDLTVHKLTRILDGITSPSEAEHFHRAAKTFFKWCVERHLLPTSPIEGLRAPSRWKSRERVLNDEELRAVWKATGDKSTFSIIVRLLLLMGQRRSEVASLKAEWCSLPLVLADEKSSEYLRHSAPENTDCEVRWVSPEAVTSGEAQNRQRHSELGSLPQCTITIPSTHTKNKRSHTFPIGSLSTSTLESCSLMGATQYLFPARGKTSSPFSGFSKAKLQLDNKTQCKMECKMECKIALWTLHDLRRTYATNLQRLGIKLEVIEALLNHVSGTRAGIVGVYNRHRYEAEMREAVTTFDRWFTQLIGGNHGR